MDPGAVARLKVAPPVAGLARRVIVRFQDALEDDHRAPKVLKVIMVVRASSVARTTMIVFVGG